MPDSLTCGGARSISYGRWQWCLFQQPGGVGVGDGVGLCVGVGAVVDGAALGDAAADVLLWAVALGLAAADVAGTVGVADADGDPCGLDKVADGTADCRALALATATAV